MDETLGKRIVSQRKRLGLTQDALAEKLGVTAQAVSKWENDQSCPDITTLPKLAEIFSITTDELLGLKKQEVREAEVIREEQAKEEPEGFHVQNGLWEFRWDGGQKSSLGFALWVLLVGGILLASNFCPMAFTLWELLWPSALMIFGLFGLYPRFSMFRFGCAFFGGYFLLENLGLLHLNLGMNLIFPFCLLLFGLSLLIDALRKPKTGTFHINRNGKTLGDSAKNYCNYEGEGFDCTTSFGENDYLIRLPRLSGGRADVSFGELSIDLSGCEEIADGCRIEASCSFGELEILVPRTCRVEPTASTAFAAVEVMGSPDPGAAVTILLDCSASFGEVTIRYI